MMKRFIYSLFALALAGHAYAQGITTSPSGSASTVVLISTQTASSSPSIQWLSIPTYSYYQMLCTDIVTASSTTNFNLQFGEGSTPTWETSSYTFYNSYNFSGSTGAPLGTSSTSASGIQLSNAGNPASGTGGSMTLQLMLSNLAGTTDYHAAHGIMNVTYGGGSTVDTGITIAGRYFGDTNAITAIRLIPSVGMISTGKCSLYGMSS